MSQSKIKVKTKTQSYNIIIGNNLIKNLSKILKDNSMNFKKCLLVIDKKVPKKNLKNINNTIPLLNDRPSSESDSLL